MAERDNSVRLEQTRPLVVTVFNQKGGIGKTTTTVNLSVVLAAMSQKVALIDLDSQSSATSSLGMTAPAAAGSYRLITGGGSLAEAMVATPFPGLWLCPASDELVGADIELALADAPQTHLRSAIFDQPPDVDVVLIDCPPALGMLPVNALVASDMALLPVAPEPLAREGLLKAWRHIHRIRANLNQSLHVLGVLLTMVDKSPVHREFSATIRSEFGSRVLPITVPRDPAILAASAQEMPVAVFDPQSAAARAYVELAHMLLASRRRAAGPGDDDIPDLPAWLRSQSRDLDHAAVTQVLLRWRDEVAHNVPPTTDMPTLPDFDEQEQEQEQARRREAAPSGAGRALALLVVGLGAGFALGANQQAVLALLASLVP